VDPGRYERLQDLFLSLSDLPEPDRARNLERLQAEDPELGRPLSTLFSVEPEAETLVLLREGKVLVRL